MIRGTIEYNSDNQKVFLPELSCDFFIGIMKPNKVYIDNEGYEITKDIDCKENDIVYAKLDYYNQTCEIITIEEVE